MLHSVETVNQTQRHLVQLRVVHMNRSEILLRELTTQLLFETPDAVHTELRMMDREPYRIHQHVMLTDTSRVNTTPDTQPLTARRTLRHIKEDNG